MRLFFRRIFLNEHGREIQVSVEYTGGENNLVELRLKGPVRDYQCVMTLREAYEMEMALRAVRQKNETISRH